MLKNREGGPFPRPGLGAVSHHCDEAGRVVHENTMSAHGVQRRPVRVRLRRRSDQGLASSGSFRPGSRPCRVETMTSLAAKPTHQVELVPTRNPPGRDDLQGRARAPAGSGAGPLALGCCPAPGAGQQVAAAASCPGSAARAARARVQRRTCRASAASGKSLPPKSWMENGQDHRAGLLDVQPVRCPQVWMSNPRRVGSVGRRP